MKQQNAHREQLVEAERVARETQRRLDCIVMTAMDAIVTVDEDKRIVLVNAATEKMFGYSAQELHGQPFEVLIPAPLLTAQVCHFDELRKAGHVAAARSISGSRRNGETFPIEASLSRVESGGRQFFTAIIRDVSERVALQAARDRADGELRRLNAQLDRRVFERTAELEAAITDLKAFSSSVSHDLRAPLRAADSFCSMLLQDHAAQLDTEGRRLLDVVRKNVTGMGQLIGDLLDFSRAGTQSLRWASLAMEPLAREVFAGISPADGRRADFSVTSVPSACADPALIRQVLVNLLTNAVKFSGKRPDPAITFRGRVKGDEALYEISDNGVGFDSRYVGKLFGIFQRLHAADEFPGTGIGLSIVQRIVTKHGGRVWAESRPGAGATFGFSLPRCEPPVTHGVPT
ncbi:MAG TPA: ATP-binding protein [Verrucomicrobiae bacterium]|nr:ATP-binding protein [Verrucomicrobiae bacterium]